MNIYSRALGVEDRMLTGVLGIPKACMWLRGFGICGPLETLNPKPETLKP